MSDARGLLVTGTSSDAGKSLVVTGICRLLARRGHRVAPFKSQNMSNNSMVCADGSEIGRAQYLQAYAARTEASSAMNPVLLKPGSDRRSHIIVRGRPAGTLGAGEYATGRRHLAEAAFAAYAELQQEYDVIVAEGAGSPAEINLRRGDYVNLGLARAFELPTIVVGDIDRGGVFASLYGTVGLLNDADRALIRGFLLNKFRGDETLLDPALREITERTGVPFLGVLPWLPDVWIDSEDSLLVGRWPDNCADIKEILRVAVVRLPRISNATDIDALALEPGVQVTVTADPGALAAADLVVIPGSRATVSDLEWLRQRGLAAVITQRAARRRPVLGICGGYQMLARSIVDSVESGAGHVAGLGILPTDVRFSDDKVTARPSAIWRGHSVEAYEIHHGIAQMDNSAAGESFPGGWGADHIWGTTWHGTFENDGFRRAWLQEIADIAGVNWSPDSHAPAYADRRERMVETLADAIECHADVDALLALIGLD